MIGQILLPAGIFAIPTVVLIAWFKIRGRQVQWFALLLAAISFTIYLLLLRSPNIIPTPAFLDGLTQNWVGKTLSILGTLSMIYLMPKIDFQGVGLTLKQNEGSLRPVLLVGVVTVISTMITATFLSATPDTSLEWLTFQAILPGLDEELYMRGLLLLLFHQAFGKGIQFWGTATGWGFVLVVMLFSLLHGVTLQDGGLSISLPAILVTGFIGVMLTWMRERTGSLIAPIIFHNSINIALSFF